MYGCIFLSGCIYFGCTDVYLIMDVYFIDVWMYIFMDVIIRMYGCIFFRCIDVWMYECMDV